MKLKIIILFIIILLLAGCDEEITQEPEKNYVQFTQNIHDWIFEEESIETLNKVIDIHEEYNVPVDVYLNHQSFQNYMENAPELIERLKTSNVVAVSYHIRPPYPVYEGFDFIGLEDMDEDTLYNTLLDYEEHELDLETGLTTDNPGGYQNIKDTIDYAPIAIGLMIENPEVKMTLANIYKEKGASFAIAVRRDVDLGEMYGPLYMRPEHAEIKWYEYSQLYRQGLTTAEEVIEENIAEYDTPIFINIKMHENDFYAAPYTPWTAVYYEGGDKSLPLEPPYDLSAWEGVVLVTPDNAREEKMDWYEQGVKYVSEHPELFEPINCKDLVEMI